MMVLFPSGTSIHPAFSPSKMSKLREQSQQDDLTPGTPQSSSLPGDLPGDKENKVQHDAVFGEIQETGPDYRNVSIPLVPIRPACTNAL